MRRAWLARLAVLALLAAAPALAQESESTPAAPAVQGLSFRLVDDAADPTAHTGEVQAEFRDQRLWLEPDAPRRSSLQ